MRVIECNFCGDTLQADSDEALARRLGAHLADEHDETLEGEELQELIADEAYEAMDS
jgi:predicted small metal-binding protein